MNCWFCGKRATDRHHCIGGPYRPKSEKYGLVVWLCHECHMKLHQTHEGSAMMLECRKWAQRKFMRDHPDMDFIKTFGHNYLDEGEETEQEEYLDLSDIKLEDLFKEKQND